MATICARFGTTPSKYMRENDWEEMQYDYFIAKQLNEIDQKKEDARWAAISGK